MLDCRFFPDFSIVYYVETCIALPTKRLKGQLMSRATRMSVVAMVTEHYVEVDFDIKGRQIMIRLP